MQTTRDIEIKINGEGYVGRVDVRTSLADFLREEIGLVGTHLGCEQGVCGACTVILDGRTIRSCLLFAVQANGKEVETVEGLSSGETLHPIQQAFMEQHGLQCGFCTSGFLMTVYEYLTQNRDVTDGDVRETISGNLCRCTGYDGIVNAVRAADAAWERPSRGDPA